MTVVPQVGQVRRPAAQEYLAVKYVDRSWEYINRSQTLECGNWDGGHAIPRKGIHK
jgi:hypothetical protein